MPTGPLHDRAVNSYVNGEITQDVFPCRCLIGEDHLEGPSGNEDEYEDDGDSFSFDGAEEIWLSSGKDEDYDFR